MRGFLRRQVVSEAAAEAQRPKRQMSAFAALWYGPQAAAERGIVCDVSPQGIFLQPLEHGTVSLLVGMRVRVVFVARFGNSDVKVDASGIVRWVGMHPRHKSTGVGIEFEMPHPELDSA
jgi:hypothetical protein